MFRFAHGLYATSGCIVKPMSRKQSSLMIGGFAVAHTVSISVEGTYLGTSPGDNASFGVALSEQLKIPNLACGIQWYDGAAWQNTAYWLSLDGTLDGPTVKDVVYNASPLEHIVEATFGFTIEATYTNTQTARTVFQYDEAISWSGDGDAVWGLAPQATLKSIYQKTAEFSDCILTQSGIVSGKGTVMVLMPSPIVVDPRAKVSLSTGEGRRFVQRQTGAVVNELTYSYTFQLPEKTAGIVPGRLT